MEIIPMVFYIYIYIIFCIYTCICLKNKDLIIKTSLDAVSPLSIGLKFITQLNNTSGMDYLVEGTPDRCCLMIHKGDNDCNSMQIVGGCSAVVTKGTTKNLNLVAPLIDPFERQGYCIFYVDSHPIDRRRNVMRDEIKIKFDTRLSNKRQSMDVSQIVQPCPNLDEDPMNSCNPVDCEVHYNGVKNFYSNKEKRCIETPTCLSDTQLDDPENIIYNPITNKCTREPGISDDDVKYIKALTNRDRHVKDILIIKNVIPKDGFETEDKQCAKCKSALVIHQKKISHKCQRGTFKKLIVYLMANKYILIVLGLVILVQCCMICTMIYCLSKSCACCRKKKVESKYFNYRQDVSVTTPLIYTSNIDTETTDYQFVSDSFNVDKKIKCYKACEKERKSNVKLSMSDDILSKCLNRREWDRVSKSDAIPESVEVGRDKTEPVANKVSFDNVKDKSDEVSNNNDDKCSRETEVGYNIRNDLSEKELKCHTYNYFVGRPNTANVKPTPADRNENNVKGISSNSIEKGAQACFSNDSFDEFLSEHGVIVLTEGNLSNSLLCSSEAVKSTTMSSVSSKTSKNNIVKNVLSLLSRRSKPSSVPGTKKSKDNLDLELIHMSRASVFSSSTRSDRGLKKNKDSRTSL